ncbi:hypothetical protein C8T65DRAFT_701067 [Cerioporus squamosus]|nr:hypothetical protein C8T65DRAFT_701067 [Cerioporus squamosus]
MGIDVLPGEIFAIIFEHVVASERQSSFRVDFKGTETVDTRSLITITHACSHWRAIALSIPSLWSRVDTTNRHKLKTFYERSREAPLSLIVNAALVKSTPVHRDLLVACSPRLRRLDLALGKEGSKDIDELLRLDAPALECLVVCQGGWWYSHLNPSFIDRPRQIRRCLRALAFWPLASWMPQTPLPSLTHIYLSFNTRGMSFNGDPLVSLLSGCPALEHIHLSQLSAYLFVLQGISIPLVHLKSLSFTNESSLSSAVSLMVGLSIPETALVRLECDADFDFSDTLPVFSTIPRMPYLNSVNGPTKLDIGCAFKMLYLLPEGGQTPSTLWLQARGGLRDMQRVQIISATSSSPAYIGDLKRMLHARTSVGYPIRSLAVQVIDAASIDKGKLESGRTTTVHDRGGGADPSISAAYVDQLANLVDEFRFYAPEDSPFPPPATSELWRVPGSEDYWTLPEHDQPVSKFPWVY